MHPLLQALERHAAWTPGQAALAGPDATLDYAGTWAAVQSAAAVLDRDCIALALDNGPAWIVADLALLLRGATALPVPDFFSAAQVEHLIGDAQPDALLTDDPSRWRDWFGGAARPVEVAGARLTLLYRNGPPGPGSPGAAKITYTSGTTGEPKGVCLNAALLGQVAASLQAATLTGRRDRFLSLLPLPMLLENLAGAWVPLLAGATATLLPLRSVGLSGSSAIETGPLLATLAERRPTCIVTVPGQLRALVEAAEAGSQLPDSLRFVAVGGAPVARTLLARARAQGIPVYEGYGLSEAGSVVSVNTPPACRDGSVGRPLPHARLRFAPDGELLLPAQSCGRILGSEEPRDGWYPTGDLGFLDEDGFLHLTGRRKNMYVTAFGRNIAPEWIERELLAMPAIRQCAVFGEAQPHNVVVIVPSQGIDSPAVAAAIAAVNQRLPDYARIADFVLAMQPFTPANGLLTHNGRPRRAQIAAAFAVPLAQLFHEEVT